jgi:hypothetical protein
MYQTAKFNEETINAFNLTAEAYYVFDKVFLKPILGFGGSFITGDDDKNDNQLNSYDPMYPKPVYGLASPYGPSNITNLRFITGIQPTKQFFINMNVYFLARQSNQDGSYTPSMDQIRPFPPYSTLKKKLVHSTP